MPNILALYLKGNPCVRMISQYRKNITIAMPNLHYLDERPIFEYERLMADAFGRGGKEEEERVRKEWADKQQADKKRNLEHAVKLMDEGKQKRKKAFKQMMADIRQEKSDLIERHKELKADYKR